MADSAAPKFDPFSKENRWYYNDLTNHISLSSRQLLEQYSHIPRSEVDAHIYKLRDILWSQAPYPCIGHFRFLTLHLPNHPFYPRITSQLKPPDNNSTSASTSPSSDNQPKFLDLACCVAQELRNLSHAGVPSQNLYGTDLNPDFLSTSYDLFADRDRFKGTLKAADMFSKSLFEQEFVGWDGRFDVIHAGLFLHLFSWEKQIEVCEIVIKLLKKEKGSLFVGEMVGCKGGAEGEATLSQKERPWLHDAETWKRLWEEVEGRSGTRGCWRVEGWFRERDMGAGDEREDGDFFRGAGVGWIRFGVERL